MALYLRRDLIILVSLARYSFDLQQKDNILKNIFVIQYQVLYSYLNYLNVGEGCATART